MLILHRCTVCAIEHTEVDRFLHVIQSHYHMKHHTGVIYNLGCNFGDCKEMNFNWPSDRFLEIALLHFHDTELSRRPKSLEVPGLQDFN